MKRAPGLVSFAENLPTHAISDPEEPGALTKRQICFLAVGSTIKSSTKSDLFASPSAIQPYEDTLKLGGGKLLMSLVSRDW